MKHYITETIEIRRKLKEQDQMFYVGDYNVDFYFDEYLDHASGKEFYLLIISEFNGDELVKKKSLYIHKEDEETYSRAWQNLHDEGMLKLLMEPVVKENTRMNARGKSFMQMERSAK